MAPKRKADAASTAAAKKAKLNAELATGRTLVEDILSEASGVHPFPPSLLSSCWS
jgi:hypothetical protein